IGARFLRQVAISQRRGKSPHSPPLMYARNHGAERAPRNDRSRSIHAVTWSAAMFRRRHLGSAVRPRCLEAAIETKVVGWSRRGTVGLPPAALRTPLVRWLKSAEDHACNVGAAVGVARRSAHPRLFEAAAPPLLLAAPPMTPLPRIRHAKGAI